MKFDKLFIQKVKDESDIREHVPGLKGSGASRYCKCPQCGKEGKSKGLIVTHKKANAGKFMNIGKCFSCGYVVKDSISARMEFYNEDFPTAVQAVAKISGIPIPEKSDSANTPKPAVQSFCEQQLILSGLREDDVLVKVPIPGTTDFRLESPFRKGGIDWSWNANTSDDDMLIYYYDLDGNYVTFSPKGTRNKRIPYIRIRYSNPELHKDKNGKPTKYKTPPGQQCIFYIPEKIRSCYRNSETIETLFIQEGEKKAEKACKHGMLSLGIQGIYNIGNSDSGLIKELQYIVNKCHVKNVVLVMDADWDSLGRSITTGSDIDARPAQFSKAVIKFKQYVSTLHNLGYSVDIWWGHVNDIGTGEKGIDDLLYGSMHNREQEVIEDISKVMHSHDGKGHFLDIHKISALTDMQIRDFWLLNSRDKFFEKYKSKIESLTTFRFGRIYFNVDEGNIKEAGRKAANKNFWSISYKDYDGDKPSKKNVDLDLVCALDFLEDNNFFRVHTVENALGEYIYVKVDFSIVTEISAPDIRSFIYDYVRQSTSDHDVHNKFASSLGSFMGADKLERLSMIECEFFNPDINHQNLFFNNGQCHITSSKIEFGPFLQRVWKDNVIDRSFKRVQIFKYIGKHDDGYFFDLTPDGQRCEFLKYILNTCNFYKGREQDMTDAEQDDFIKHVINRITCIGYLLHDAKPMTEQKAVIAMDAKMGEIGDSNGRSGKSLIGKALAEITNQKYIDGKKIDNDKFIYQGITFRTRNAFLDDVKVNFNFEDFYTALTSGIDINTKGDRFTLSYEYMPKFYITTNHSINDTSDSGKARRMPMAFSNYYNISYRPVDEFGHQFFSDWDDDQWCLFDNLMAECVQTYLRSFAEEWEEKGCGMVSPPMRSLDLREDRQVMGEAFLQWADEYFDPTGQYLNAKVIRKDAFNDFSEQYPEAAKFTSANKFRKKLIAFCHFKGYHLNAFCKDEKTKLLFPVWKELNPSGTFIGEQFKSGGKEFFCISTDEYSAANFTIA